MSRSRLFFALWPSETEAAQAVVAAEKLLGHRKARRVPAQRIHLTLLFVGSVASEMTDVIATAAEAVQGTRFVLQLDTAGYWRRPQVVWLAPSSPPPALMRLAERLREAVGNTGVALETRRFKPHITLARQVVSAPDRGLTEPLRWHINGFGLYQSVTHASGPDYQLVRHFPCAEP